MDAYVGSAVKYRSDTDFDFIKDCKNQWLDLQQYVAHHRFLKVHWDQYIRCAVVFYLEQA